MELLERLQGPSTRAVAAPLFERLGTLSTPPGVLGVFPRPARLDEVDLEGSLSAPRAGARRRRGRRSGQPRSPRAQRRGRRRHGARRRATGGARPFTPKALRGSMGSLLRLPVYEISDLGRAVGALERGGFRQRIAATRGGAPLDSTSFSERVVVWMSGETGEAPAGAARLRAGHHPHGGPGGVPQRHRRRRAHAVRRRAPLRSTSGPRPLVALRGAAGHTRITGSAVLRWQGLRSCPRDPESRAGAPRMEVTTTRPRLAPCPALPRGRGPAPRSGAGCPPPPDAPAAPPGAGPRETSAPTAPRCGSGSAAAAPRGAPSSRTAPPAAAGPLTPRAGRGRHGGARARAAPARDVDYRVLLEVEGAGRTSRSPSPRRRPTPRSPSARVAFGSCASHDRFEAQPIWTVHGGRAAPDALVLLGDTPYIDSTELARQRRRYQGVLVHPRAPPARRERPGLRHVGRPRLRHQRPGRGPAGAGAVAAGVHRVSPPALLRRRRAAASTRPSGAGPVEVFLVDTRWFGDEEAFGAPGSGQTSLLGAVQRERLIAAVSASDADGQGPGLRDGLERGRPPRQARLLVDLAPRARRDPRGPRGGQGQGRRAGRRGRPSGPAVIRHGDAARAPGVRAHRVRLVSHGQSPDRVRGRSAAPGARSGTRPPTPWPSSSRSRSK